MGINIKLDNCYIYSCGVVATKEEASFLSSHLDMVHDSLFAGEKNYVDGEKKMIVEAISCALSKAQLSQDDLDFILGGDLSNQITTTSEIATLFQTSYLGVFSACATSIEAINIATIILEANKANNILVYTSSNYGVVERQFRYPTTYGIQKKETNTTTVNGACAIVLSNRKTKVKVSAITFGRAIDSTSLNANDMGSIMALAAYDTLKKHLEANQETCKDYDLILTGDLSSVGIKVLIEMLKEDEDDVSMLMDAGEYIYKDNKSKFAGGSGPGCLPLVGFSYILHKLEEKEYNKVLFIATGSLHSKTSVSQKHTIPVIAHALELRRGEE